ncbi:cadherin-23-like isoform X2 [Pomacea canaliculata]|uniref:cadherin-23-like isoform X2 n=1 Tax=Pomacea canaliculata TaxID=400727 RepID=UPI000D7378F4|nr:cadherin-23-like isoform X2 [Pomacea canaliculata]
MNSVICFIIAGLCTQVSSQYGCFLNYSDNFQSLVVPEKIQSGDTFLTIVTNDNITLKEDSLLLMPFFIELNVVSLDDGVFTFSLVSNTDVTELDENKTLCEVSRMWGLKLVCQSVPNHELYINLVVNYTDDYDPVVKNGLSFEIFELMPVNSLVVNLEKIGDFYTDQDCSLGTLAIYSIQGGDTDAAFGMFSGKIVVNRLIWYQKGETKFELTVSVTTGHYYDLTGRNGSATVVINIVDIDDNDPRFDNAVYMIHVPEENSNMINVPLVTSPPVFAFDQDTGINDTVTYSINGTSDTIGIQDGTGLVWVTRVLDREAEPSVSVMIKANQVHNSWRSAVATLLVVVDDINDNHPKFQPNNTTLITIPEHSAVGSFVTRVLALDADMGENALFNYTLDSGQSVFKIQSDILGNLWYGTITVGNSSALDREALSSLNITVYTEEFRPPQGGDCSTGMCNITISIQLTDINDNAPVFTPKNGSVVLHANETAGHVIAVVRASDDDEGVNAEITYSLQPDSVLQYFSINSTSGAISIREVQPFGVDAMELLVKATDGGSPSLSAFYTLRIIFEEGIGMATVYAPAKTDAIVEDIDNIESVLRKIMGVTVTISSVRHLSPDSSVIYIRAQHTGTDHLLTSEELQKLVDASSAEIASLFRQSDDDEKKTAVDEFSLPVIVLIVVAGILLLVLVVAMVAIAKNHKRAQRQRKRERAATSSFHHYAQHNPRPDSPVHIYSSIF